MQGPESGSLSWHAAIDDSPGAQAAMSFVEIAHPAGLRLHRLQHLPRRFDLRPKRRRRPRLTSRCGPVCSRMPARETSQVVQPARSLPAAAERSESRSATSMYV